MVFIIIKKSRKNAIIFLIFSLPFLISSLITFVRFDSKNIVGSYQNGLCITGEYSDSGQGLINQFGKQIIPEKYDFIDLTTPNVIIGLREHLANNETECLPSICRDKSHYKYVDHYNIDGTFLYTEENTEIK